MGKSFTSKLSQNSRRLFLATFMLGGVYGCSSELGIEKNSGWIDMFNGKDLSNWKVKFADEHVGENYLNTFQVKNGNLVVSYDNYEQFDDKFGHLFFEQPFSHYTLQATYRFVGEQVKGGAGWAMRNNGFMIHAQSPESMTYEQKFPTSIEVQLLGGLDNGERSTANICTPDTHVVIDGALVTDHCINSSSKTYNGDQWVNVEIEVHGDEKIIHRVNGEVVFTYSKPQYDTKLAQSFIASNKGSVALNKGYIAIQAETAPVEFKSIRIKPL